MIHNEIYTTVYVIGSLNKLNILVTFLLACLIRHKL